MKKEILQTIEKYNLINNGDKIVIGVSGGPDSICLLHILNSIKSELGISIYVAHINHMIREVADDETKYVEEFCKRIGVECYIKKADVVSIAKESGKGTEETGRNIRYQFFDEVAEKVGANKIATAHNKNDRAETVIFNILRGSGLFGRDEIEKYCNDNNLDPKYDESNLETVYTRNKIRNIVLPYIKKEFNPNIINTINRLSEVAEEENNYLNKITEDAFNNVLIEKNKNIALDLKKFNNLELVIKRRVILYTINEILGTTQGIEKINIEEIINLCTKNIGNKFLIPTKAIKILVKNKIIFFIPNHDLP